MISRILLELLVLVGSTIASIIVVLTGLLKVLFNAPSYIIHIFVENYKEVRSKVL